MAILSRPGTLKAISEHLEARKDVTAIFRDPKRESFTFLDHANWFELVEVRVAPLEPIYTIQGLERLLPLLVPPEVTMANFSEGRFRVGVVPQHIKLAKLFFDEEVGRIRQVRLIESADGDLVQFVRNGARNQQMLTSAPGALDGGTTSMIISSSSPVIRRIMLRLYPDMESAQRGHDDFDMRHAPKDARQAFSEALRADMEGRRRRSEIRPVT